jgi:pyridoxamine 5'-phosphate oxidase
MVLLSRVNRRGDVMDERELGADPLVQLRAWLDEAEGAVPQAQTMTLATATPDGRPSARQVLLRDVDERGLAFFTNRRSRKAEELTSNPRAAVVFHWYELGRQVRVEGGVEQIDASESDAYWRSRPRASQIAAWASPQSRPLASRTALDELYALSEERFGDDAVPRPPFWGGYRVVPDTIEFWEHREDRLHDRVRYVREDAGWRRERLAP